MVIKTELENLLCGNRTANIEMYANNVLKLDGSVLEFGVYRGGTLERLAKIFKNKKVYGLDTFRGIPQKGSWDRHNVGDFKDVNYRKIEEYFQKNCPNVTLIQGYFPRTFYHVKNEKFCFLHLDADQYQSTLDGLDYLYPRVVPGGVVMLDDYEWKACPGVKQAVTEFFSWNTCSHQEKLKDVCQYLIIK